MNLHSITNIRLYYAVWEDLPDEVQAVFIGFMGGNPDAGRSFYQLYFYGYNIPHEIGHILRQVTGMITDWDQVKVWTEEMTSNRFAVAFWRAAQADELLARLEDNLRLALTHIPDPIPAGYSREEYFNQHYQEMIAPQTYAFIQFNQVMAALARPETLEEVLEDAYKQQLAPTPSGGWTLDVQIDSDQPARTVAGVREALACYSLPLPEIRLVCAYYPALQFIKYGEQQEP